ncbi:MAG: type II toxin-antitoxin system ParD family antitoxin [Acidobacteriia bacterium]|nr:type II toxin-antitoxin system ParD family antitoxin [Terriglobia bacterium]
MNVNLTPELEKLVHNKVKTGRYNSASEVVREALRLLEDHDKVRVAQLSEFRREIDRRLASLDRGESIEGEKFFAELERPEAALRR